jgi:hypothetical protein
MKGGELKQARAIGESKYFDSSARDVAAAFIELLNHLKRLAKLVTTEHGPEFTADVRALIRRAEGRVSRPETTSSGSGTGKLKRR